ncbi:MAG: MerR family transcriptional regulator [Proteobacteria bacterium]|nr:MerR family transcriptional regulator [Pseudomonadota bacterium]
MNYSIGKFSQMMGVSIYTLRYYEKLGLIVPVRRDNGQRRYSENDVTWLQFIKRLKATGMPIKEIQTYAELRSNGDSTMPQRMEMLVIHRTALKEEIAKLQEHLENLDNKIDYYQCCLKGFSTVEFVERQ